MTIWNMEITAAESPQTVHIPLEGKYYAIKNTGEHDILVSSSVTNPTEGADDVMKIPSGSAAIIPVKDGDLYVSSEEDGTYSISIQDDKVIPWSGGTGTGSGDGVGDNTHYKGTTTTALENGSTTNPITIDGESYTAVFGDVVVYGYTEFVFDGTQWSEFGRPFDTVPTQGSTNAVTSDGVYRSTSWWRRGSGSNSSVGGQGCSTRGGLSLAYGFYATADGYYSAAFGSNVSASQYNMLACGKNNRPNQGDLFNVGNGTDNGLGRSNIVEVNSTSANVNGYIKINNIAIPTPYTTMPTITAAMLGQIAMYVGATGNGYTQGCFYVAYTDGAAEPTYSWVRIGGGRTETVLWENDGTTNPQTITLSEAWSNFDELAIVTDYIYQDDHYCNTNLKLTSTFIIGENAMFWYYDNSVTASYAVTSSTTFTYNDGGGQHFLYKIIGIKY